MSSSESIVENTSSVTVLTYQEAVKEVTQKYLDLCLTVQDKFKHHHDLAGALEAGIRNFKERAG
jgi:hypothetical protein